MPDPIKTVRDAGIDPWIEDPYRGRPMLFKDDEDEDDEESEDEDDE